MQTGTLTGTVNRIVAAVPDRKDGSDGPSPRTGPGSLRPFDALDAEWARLCRRHRRSTVVARWARQQPALASLARLDDVIPPPDVDRRPYCQAFGSLAADGDDLAARALLQLLVPGLVRLAARWR